MNDYEPLLSTIDLFSGINIIELEPMLGCLSSEKKIVRKGGIILLAGEKPGNIGVVLTGQLHIVRDDYEGNRSLIAVLTPGDIFAEALCCAGVSESPVTVLADLDSTVLLLKFERIMQTCPNSCEYHRTLIENMLGIIAKKNLLLQSRMEIISMKSIRARVLRYLESLAPRKGSQITVPLNREEMANFICVERSALSHELMKMRMDGLIDYRKNKFVLKV